MRIICTAMAEEAMRRENLAQCVRILGGEPIAGRDYVKVDFAGDKSQVDKFVELFEQFVRNEIRIFD